MSLPDNFTGALLFERGGLFPEFRFYFLYRNRTSFFPLLNKLGEVLERKN